MNSWVSIIINLSRKSYKESRLLVCCGGFSTLGNYNLIVIGSGAAAQTIVYECAAIGWKVGLVEQGKLGGTCALRGCIPKKVLVGAGETIDLVHNMGNKGVKAENICIDWAELVSFKNTFTDQTPTMIKQGLIDAGIDIYQDSATFIDESTIQVGDQKLSSDYFVIASGSHPRPLNIPGEEFVLTSDEFFNLKELPSSLVFIGGGYISFELAHIAVRSEVEVTILHRSEQPLMQFESELVELLLQASEEIGIRIELNMPVHAVEKRLEGFSVIAGENNQKFNADLVIHGAGRIPTIEGLNLKRAHIRTGRRGIKVNDYMQSVSNPRVYAAGDVAASGLPLTPVAGAEGKVVLKNLLEKNWYHSNISVIPSTLFTVPPLSSVGITEQIARKKGVRYEVKAQDTSSWFSSKRIGLKHSGYKLLIDKNNGQFLGAHLLGHHADEVINIFSLAMTYHLTVDQLKQMVWSYPTSTYDINYML
jgi:glutathione reductase (NADPH)